MLDQQRWFTPGPISTEMGDRIGVQLSVREVYVGLTNHSDQLSLAIPPWVGEISTSQRAVMLCSWGVKTGMTRVWWQVKLCEPLYNTYVLEAKLLRLSAIKIYVYFSLLWQYESGCRPRSLQQV